MTELRSEIEIFLWMLRKAQGERLSYDVPLVVLELLSDISGHLLKQRFIPGDRVEWFRPLWEGYTNSGETTQVSAEVAHFVYDVSTWFIGKQECARLPLLQVIRILNEPNAYIHFMQGADGTTLKLSKEESPDVHFKIISQLPLAMPSKRSSSAQTLTRDSLSF